MTFILTTMYLLDNSFIYAKGLDQSILVRSENVDSSFLARDAAVGKLIQ